MITLYHAPQTRSSRFIWLLEEIGAPYRIEKVAIRRRDQPGDPREAAYRRVHPHGKVPAIDHDGAIVFESAAIALYLGDAFPEAKLGVAIGDPKRGAYVTWHAYYAGVVEPAFVAKALSFTVTNSTTGWAPTEEILDYVVGALSTHDWLLGDRFTTADVLFGSTFALFQGSPLLPKNDVLAQYVDRIKARPAYRRALEKDA